jgi:hypothetical protein
MTVKEEAFRLKKALESADQSNSYAELKDVLKALYELQDITEAIIKESKLGKELTKLKKKYDVKEPSIGKDIMNILKVWTRIAKQAKANVEEGNTPLKKINNQKIDPFSELSNYINDAGSLTPSRQKIIDLFIKTISLPNNGNKDVVVDTNSVNTIDLIAAGIEALCFLTYPCDATGKQTEYTAKVRSLNFNLKKNSSLRLNVRKGDIHVKRLIVMTADELATEKLIEQRKAEAAEDEESRRQDWHSIHESEIVNQSVERAGGKIAAMKDTFKFDDESEEVSDDD